MAIDPKSITWDEPAKPSIDPAGIVWDEPAAPAQAQAPQEATSVPPQGMGVSDALKTAYQSLMGSFVEPAANVQAGAVRGAGSIGSTLLAPYDMAKDAMAGKGLSLESNRERRAGIDGGLAALGADPESKSYAGGKLVGEIAGTSGIGPALAIGARGMGASPAVVSALESGGLNVGGLTGFRGLGLRAAAGGATGAATAGAINPEDVGTGAVIGATFPLAARGIAQATRSTVGGVRSLLEPLYEQGQNRIVGRSLREFAGDQVDNAIRNLQSAQELVPGSRPTVGEAAQVPSLAALQRSAFSNSADAANALQARLTENNQARVDLLNTLTGSPAARAAAEDFRDRAAAEAYGAARARDEARRAAAMENFQQETAQAMEDAARYTGLGALGNAPRIVPPANTAITPSNELLDLARRPTMQRMLATARRLAADKGEDIGNPLESIDGLHYVKLAVDDALAGTPGNALARNQRAAVMDIKERLVAEMDKVSPAYAEARRAYQQASVPINQMDIGAELSRAVDPLTGRLRASQFARMLNDETARRATGSQQATLAGVLSNEQLASLNALRDDLARAEFAQTAGRGVGSNTAQNLAYSNMLNQAGVPNFLRNFSGSQILGSLASRAGDAVYGRANQQIGGILSRAMLDPAEAAQLMMLQQGANPALIDAGRRGLLGVGRAAPVISAD